MQQTLLKANNSSEDLKLVINTGENDGVQEFYFCAYGKKDKKPIQVDFDYLTKKELKKLIKKLNKVLKSTK